MGRDGGDICLCLKQISSLLLEERIPFRVDPTGKGGKNSRVVSSVSITNHRNTDYVVLLFYVHGKHLRSCRDGQLT